MREMQHFGMKFVEVVAMALAVASAGCDDSTSANSVRPSDERPAPHDRSDEVLVTDALNGSDGEVAMRVLAARTSIEQNNPTREHLRTVFRESDDPQVRVAAIRGIAKGWDYDAMEDLLDALDDESLEVRQQAGVVVQKMIGLKFRYNASDPPGKRGKVVAQMRKMWEGFRDTGRLENWLERLPTVHEQLNPLSD